MRSQSEIRLAVIGQLYMNPLEDAIAGIAARGHGGAFSLRLGCIERRRRSNAPSVAPAASGGPFSDHFVGPVPTKPIF